MVDTADLINRQKAEIERLEAMNSELRIGIKVLKRNAIKEFAEEFERRCIQCGIYPAFIKATLNNLVRSISKMTERERLIELIHKSEILCDTCGENSSSYCAEYLADYLIANGVIALPEKVYWYDMGGNLKEAMVRDKFFAELENGFEYDITYGEIGKTVFLTKEEAEQALRKEDGKNEDI